MFTCTPLNQPSLSPWKSLAFEIHLELVCVYLQVTLGNVSADRQTRQRLASRALLPTSPSDKRKHTSTEVGQYLRAGKVTSDFTEN